MRRSMSAQTSCQLAFASDAAASAQILGTAVVLIGDMNQARLAHARSVGFEAIDLRKSDNLEDLIEAVLGEPAVDAAVDAVDFEANGHGVQHAIEAPATVSTP
jgi:glutathione-independent formaldehyde dehydrogenase